jgi:hypothetical protein
MADFVDGIFLKRVETKYGDIIKVSFDVDKFYNYLMKSGKVVESESNGRKYFNAEIKKSKNEKYYIEADSYVPNKQEKSPFAKAPDSTPPEDDRFPPPPDDFPY